MDLMSMSSAFGPGADRPPHVCDLDALADPTSIPLGSLMVCVDVNCVRTWRTAELSIANPDGTTREIIGWELVL